MTIQTFAAFNSKLMKALPYTCVSVIGASFLFRGTWVADLLAVGFVAFSLAGMLSLVILAVWAKRAKVDIRPYFKG